MAGSINPLGLSGEHRPLRLRIWNRDGGSDDSLLVKHASGTDTVCGGIDYTLFRVSTEAGKPLKQFIANPVELLFVTDTGNLRPVCGIVAAAAEGQSDGGLATYQLIVRDALSLLEKTRNTASSAMQAKSTSRTPCSRSGLPPILWPRVPSTSGCAD